MATILNIAGPKDPAGNHLAELATAGHRVIEAASAFEAILLLTSEAIDIVLVADSLPDLDMTRFLLLAHCEKRDLRVLMVADTIPSHRIYGGLVQSVISTRNCDMLLPMVELLVYTRAAGGTAPAPLLSQAATEKFLAQPNAA